MRKLLLPIFLASFIYACQAQLPRRVMQLSDTQRVTMVDSVRASLLIVRDDMEGFFQKITPTEMSIQLRIPFTPTVSRDSILGVYYDFIMTEVSDFTLNEIELLREVIATAYALCNNISPSIFPYQLRLLKVKTNHYGPSVYYTRENFILIPENELTEENKEDLIRVMLHEIFHIYSRLSPMRRVALYKLIGFRPLGINTQDLIMPDTLRSRLLHNPDGIDFAWSIRLGTGDKSVEVIPVISANRPGFEPGRPNFFDYLNFELLPVQKSGATYQVVTKDGYHAPQDYTKHPDFLQQITDNTTYIIHPDEILADNFTLLALATSKNIETPKISVAGRTLLDNLRALLQDSQ